MTSHHYKTSPRRALHQRPLLKGFQNPCAPLLELIIPPPIHVYSSDLNSRVVISRDSLEKKKKFLVEEKLKKEK